MTEAPDTARALVFPGLDGDAALLQEFAAAAPAGIQVSVCPLPEDPAMDYSGLASHFGAQLKAAAPCWIIAESCSGPLGILLAHQHSGAVRRLVLVNTFATSPFGGAGAVPWEFLAALTPPLWSLRALMTGGDDGLARSVRAAIAVVPGAVRAHRLGLIAGCDVRAELAALSCDVLLLRGADDALVPLACHQEMCALPSPARAVTLPGPHLLLQSNPAACWRAILDP